MSKSDLKTIEALIDGIYFDYCKIVLGKSLFEELDKLKSASNVNELFNAFALVDSQLSQRKELLNLLYSAKEYALNSTDPCIIELKAKLFDMLMSIRECNKADFAIKSNAVDHLKEENASLKKKITKLESDNETLRKAKDLLKTNNDSLENRIDELQRTIRRIRPFPSSIEDYIRF